jgi:hypothetical protein
VRECKTCKTTKLETEFWKSTSTYQSKNGPIHYTHNSLVCKECRALEKYIKKLARQYGLTLAQFDELVFYQENSCAICKTTFESRSTTFVDHCHKTNKVRGLLCSKCNFGIGLFKDDTEILSRAIEYLKA